MSENRVSITANEPVECHPSARHTAPANAPVRAIYATLLRTGRAYAAFTPVEQKAVAELSSAADCILDPMSGYGSLMLAAASAAVSSYTIEINPPQFYWQVLIRPDYRQATEKLLRGLVKCRLPVGKSELAILASDDWYEQNGLRLALQLFERVRAIAGRMWPGGELESEDAALAVFLPFAARFACYTETELSMRVKKGGVVSFRGLEEDWRHYLAKVTEDLEVLGAAVGGTTHEVCCDDARIHEFKDRKFAAMLTSPPYPNRHDYQASFGPENEFLAELQDTRLLKRRWPLGPPVGSVAVRGTGREVPQSAAARRFLVGMEQQSRSAVARYDDRVYYAPYYSNYFTALERAYAHVALALGRKFLGYIAVVNNTHRGQVVPVADVVMATWRRLGFQADIARREERYHIGTKNPRARGIRAKHESLLLRVNR